MTARTPTVATLRAKLRHEIERYGRARDKLVRKVQQEVGRDPRLAQLTREPFDEAISAMRDSLAQLSSGRRVFLSPEDERKLADHLAVVISDARKRDAAVRSIDRACFLARATFGWRDDFRATGEHLSRVAELAHDLGRALERERPAWKLAEFDWDQFERSLHRVATAAAVEARALKPPRGRPPERWRTDLIAAIYGAYDGRATKTRNGHFARTVALVFRLLGRPVDDDVLHAIIADALGAGRKVAADRPK